MNHNHGFNADIIKNVDYKFGGYTKLTRKALQPNCDWTAYLPKIEFQSKGNLETMNCTVYGTLNCIETLFKRHYGREVNKSERYIGVMAKTSPVGNSPQKVIETIRKESGLIDEELLPFDDTITTWEEYYNPNPMTSDYINKGKEWLEKYELGHEWVLGREDKIKEALKYSPLGASVNLSKKEEDGLYHKEWPDNHWVMIYNCKEGEYWNIFDHYDNVFKKVVWDYEFLLVKRYSLTKKLCWSWYQRLWQDIKEFFIELANKLDH